MKDICRNPICDNTKIQQKTANSVFSSSPSVNDIPKEASICNCSSHVLTRASIAQAYIPPQKYSSPTDQEQSFICGTVFSELVIPYCNGWNLSRFRKEA